MSTFTSMKPADADVVENETDSVGGSSGPLESGAYPAKVEVAYVKKAASGAVGVVLLLKTSSGRELRTTEWVQSGDAKGNNNFYVDKRSGEKRYLPGFNTVNSLCLLTAGIELYDVTTKTKLVDIYDFDLKKDIPTEVEVITDIIGKDIIVGAIRQTVDKQQKDDSGTYVNTGETRDENEINKFFRASDKLTTAEIRAESTEPAFHNTWAEKWTGVTRNKAKGGAAAGPAGTVAASNAAPQKSLFK